MYEDFFNCYNKYAYPHFKAEQYNEAVYPNEYSTVLNKQL